MVAPLPPNRAGPTRWGAGAAGAGTDRPHVTIDAPTGPTGRGAGAGAPLPPPARPGGVPPGAFAPGRVPSPPGRQRSAPPRTRRPRRRGRLGRRLFIVFVLVPLLIFGGLFAFGWYKFSQIPRVQVAAAFSPVSAAGTNYLIVGTDSRDGIDPNDPNAGAFLGEKVSGVRTDSILVMRVEDGQQKLLSIPRDLWVKDPKTGELGRINATYQSGPTNLIKAVQSLGIPVHHYLEINFVSFGRLVDSVGGIDVDFAFPSRDRASGLNIDAAGVAHLDGTQALAYSRSRHFEEFKNGKWVEDPLSDLGRVKRQQTVLTAVMGRATDTRSPVGLSNIADALSVGIKIDDALNLFDVIGLGSKLRGFHPETNTLPTTPRTTRGGADVLDLDKTKAPPVIGLFG
jgi:LCP family protein required for cell wall assembly